VGFEIHGDWLTMHPETNPSKMDELVVIYWHKEHTLNGLDGATATTLPAEYDDLICEGSGAYALLQAAIDLTNQIPHGEVSNYRVIGNEKLQRFRQGLYALRASKRKPSNIKQAIWK
jgi:hypothetical protein